MQQATEQYNIFDLGFNKYLIKGSGALESAIEQIVDDLPMPSIMGSGFIEIPPSQIGSGEIGGNLTMIAGLLQSANYVSGSAGWAINYDGSAEFSDITLYGGTVKYGKTSFTDSTNAGYWIGALGFYMGGASDVTKLKYTVADGTLSFIGTLQNSAGAAILNSSAVTILKGFTFSPDDYSGAFKSGDIAWNATTGAVESGSGIVLYKAGIVGAAAGVTTFSIDASTGSAYFKGQIYATSGYFGDSTDGIQVDSNGLQIIGSGYIATGVAGGARCAMVRSLTGGYTHGILTYDTSENLIFRLMADGGSPALTMFGTENQGSAQFINSASAATFASVKIQGQGIQHILWLRSDGSTTRGTFESEYALVHLDKHDDYGPVFFLSVDTANNIGNFLMSRAIASKHWDFINMARSGGYWTAIQDWRITIEGYLQFPAYYHCSEFDENITGYPLLSATVIANAYWDASGTNGTVTLYQGSNEDENTYVELDTTATGSSTAIMAFGRYIGAELPAIEIRCRFSSKTNAVYRFGFQYDATHYAYFEFDSAVDADKIYLSSNNSAQNAQVDTGMTINTTSWRIYRLMIFPSNVMKCWWGNTEMTSGTQYPGTANFKPYFYASNKTADESKKMYIDYVKVWRGRNDTTGLS